MKTAYSYIRFSRPEQLKGDSLRRQLEAGQAYAERHGLRLDESSFRDLGLSAFKSKHAKQGALGEFLDAVQAGRIRKGSVLIVESLDRLSRDQIKVALSQFLAILSAGIEIVTLIPEATYTDAGINDIASILTALVYMSRAHEESATKSKRITQAWSNKRANIATKKLTGRCPAWLRLNDDRRQYEPIPDRVAIVRRIVRMALDGHGSTKIAKTLNGEGVPCIGRGSDYGHARKDWHKSYIQKIIRNPALRGEYQPHVGHASNRKPVGQPVQDYFPRVISDADFWKLQAATKGKPGRAGVGTPNLFSGLLFDKADGATLTLCDKGKRGGGKMLVNSRALRGVQGSVYVSFPYATFEQCILGWLPEIKPVDLVDIALDTERDSEADEARLADVEARLTKIKQRMAADTDLDTLLDVVATLSKERDELAQRIEGANQTRHSEPTRVALAEAVSLVKLDTGDEDVRRKLKGKIKRLVNRIEVLISRAEDGKVAFVEIELCSGRRRRIVAGVEAANGQVYSAGHEVESKASPATSKRKAKRA